MIDWCTIEPMKANTKLKICVENMTFVVLRKDVDPKLDRLVKKLEETGNEYGPVIGCIPDDSGHELFVSVNFADGKRYVP